MSDKLNGSPSEEAAERLNRADKISRIKNSLRSASQSEPSDIKPHDAPVHEKRELPKEKNASKSAYDWESEISKRIAKKNETPTSKTTAESILAELDMLVNAANNRTTPEKPVIRETVSHAVEPVIEEKPAVREVISHAVEPRPEEVEPESEEVEVIPAADAFNDDGDDKKTKKKKKNDKKSKKPFKEKLRDLLPRKEDKLGEKIRKIVFLCSIIAIVTCGYIVSDYYLDLWRSKRLNSKVMEIYSGYENEVPTANQDNIVDYVDDRPVYVMLDGAKKLLDLNKNIVGVIKIPDTPLNNPVLQVDDNEEYLDKKLDGNDSRAGELFMDCRNAFYKIDENGHMTVPNSDNIIIYGHNMKDETMFGSLKSYERDYSYYSKHPIIYFNSNYGHSIYKIFSVMILDASDKSETSYDCWNKLNFSDEEDFYNFVNEAKKRTVCTNDVDVKYGDGLLTLSTCNTLLGERGRLIVMARLLREGEDIMEGTENGERNENIKWPSIYYTYRPSAKKYDPDAEFIPYGPDDEKNEDKDKNKTDGTTNDKSDKKKETTTSAAEKKQ